MARKADRADSSLSVHLLIDVAGQHAYNRDTALKVCCHPARSSRTCAICKTMVALTEMKRKSGPSWHGEHTCYAVLGGVVGALVGGRDQGVHGARVDDPAPALLQHEGERGLGAVESRGQADRDDGVPLVLGEGVHWGHVLDAHIVHQDVEPAQVVVGVPYHIPAHMAVLRHKQKYRTQWASRGCAV